MVERGVGNACVAEALERGVGNAAVPDVLPDGEKGR